MFEVFRRHQKRLLAVLTILAMFAFAFPLTSTYFSGSRTRSGQMIEVVDTIFDRKVTNEDIRRTGWERLVANTFYQNIMAAVQPQLGWRWGAIERFGNSRDDDAIKDAIRMAHKADEFGIRVSDDMVRAWIKAETDGKLTTRQFEEAIAKLGRLGDISPEALFEILRHQLRIEQVQALVAGRFGSGPTPVTPYESWQFYLRLNDKLGLDVIPVPVADFTGQIEDPGDEVLRELYAKHIDQFPDSASPEPGFKLPSRLNLQYAWASLDAFALAIKPELSVSEEEIQQYYETRKELYRIPASVEPPAVPAEAPQKPQIESEKPEQASEKPTAPEKEAAPEKKPDEVKPGDEGQEGSECTDGPGVDAPQDNAPPTQETKSSQDTSQKDPAETEKASESNQEQEATKIEPARADEKEKDRQQYKSVQEVSDEIRDILLRDKARAELVRRLDQVGEVANDYGLKKYLPAREAFEEEKNTQPAHFEPPTPPDFAKVAAEKGLSFTETGLVSVGEELSNLPRIGQAIEVVSGRPTSRSMAEIMPARDFFDPILFRNLDEEYFSIWKCGEEPEQQPPFEDIRDKVLAAYRIIKARELAKARAEKIADMLREVGGDLAKLREKEAIADPTSIPPLPLWSNSPMFSLPMMSRQPGIQPTELPGVRLPGSDLRNALFQLREGEVTAMPNQPQDIYYVVKLAKREPASMNDFARSRQFLEGQIESEQARRMVMDWLVNLRNESAGESKKTKAPTGN